MSCNWLVGPGPSFLPTNAERGPQPHNKTEIGHAGGKEKATEKKCDAQNPLALTLATSCLGLAAHPASWLGGSVPPVMHILVPVRSTHTSVDELAGNPALAGWLGGDGGTGTHLGCMQK